MPKREHPVGCGVSLHVTWPRIAHIPHRQHHVTRQRSERTHPKWSGRRVSNSWPRPWRGRALPAELHPQKVQDGPSASTGVVLRQVVKELSPVAHWRRGRDPSIAGLRQCAGRLKSESKKARILSESGPLRTEIRGCASMRCPLPDAPGPRPDQADSSPAGSGAVRSRNRRTTASLPSSETRART